MTVLLVSYTISLKAQNFFATLLKSLEGTILHNKQPNQAGKYNIADVDSFLQKLDELNIIHSQLEERRQKAQESLVDSEELLKTVTNAVQSSVILIDHLDQVQFMNPAAEKMFGYTSEELIGKKLHQILVPDRFQEQALKGFAHFYETGTGPALHQSLELVVRHKNNREFPIELFVGKVLRDDRWWAVGAAIDISDRKQKEETLTRLAETDPLTGVNNRRNFFTLTKQEIKRCRRYKQNCFVLMFDLDHFKQVNDTHGHSVGDKVLQHFTKTCLMNLRDSDIFGRLGGEEFAAVLTGIGKEDVLLVANRIREAFRDITIEVTPQKTIPVSTSVSVGATQIDQKQGDIKQGIAAADQALYQAKANGRNQVVFKDSSEP